MFSNTTIKHKYIIKDELGKVNDATAKLYLVMPNDKPKFFKVREITYAIWPKVEWELEYLEKRYYWTCIFTAEPFMKRRFCQKEMSQVVNITDAYLGLNTSVGSKV